MAWVRLHDGAMSHPKICGLIDWRNPFCLWIWGLSYCQLHLTDGRIPRAALPNAIAMKTASRLIESSLWEAGPDAFVVHDYLEWNDSRELVQKKRYEAKERMKNARNRTPREVRANFYVDRGVSSGSSGSEKEDPFCDAAITERAGRFVQDAYPLLYQQHRKGARYVGSMHKDYAAAVELCRAWDDARLEKLAIVFLNSDHQFAENGSRTIPQFKAMASWCDGKLAEHEARTA